MKTIRAVAAVIKAVNKNGDPVVFATQRGYGNFKDGWEFPGVPCLNLDKIMIGDIMLLIPGIAMTNAIRDMLMGDTISGLMRLIESILWAGSLAVGFMASIWMVGI